MHVFHRVQNTTKMDDNSSIVALSHILDRHIMRMCYRFPLLLLKMSEGKIYFSGNVLYNQRSRNNRMLESKCRGQEGYTTRIWSKVL